MASPTRSHSSKAIYSLRTSRPRRSSRCTLWPSVNKRLEMKLRRELRLGARIVSSAFGIGNWRPDETSHAPDGSTLLLWTVPRPPAREPDVDFVPTPEAVAYEMLQLAGASARDVVYDLGSGDGRIPILAAQKYGARGVGVELDPRLVEMSLQVARDVQLADRVTFIEADLFDADISSATIVTLYLSASVNAKLESKLRREPPARDANRVPSVPARHVASRQSRSCQRRHGSLSVDSPPATGQSAARRVTISAFLQASLTTFLARTSESVCVTSRVAPRAAAITFGGPVMTRTLPAVFALAILVSPAVAVAQTTGTRPADVVATGMKVSVVDDDGRRIEGRVFDHSGRITSAVAQRLESGNSVRSDRAHRQTGQLEEWCPRGTWHWAGRRHVWRRPFVKRKHRTGVDARGHCVPNCRLDAVRHWHRRHVQQSSNALRARRTSPSPRLARRRARRPRRGGIAGLVATG